MPLSLSPRSRLLLAALLFTAAIGLNAWTLSRALQPHVLETPPIVPPIADAAELASAQHDVAGTYVTGERPGDRLIVIDETGQIRFSEIGVASAGATDTFHIGKIGKQRQLVTRQHGIVEVLGLDTLAYYGDRYTRTQAPPTPSDPGATPFTPRRPVRSASRRRPTRTTSRFR